MGSKVLEFLSDLKENNNRDWFNDHKEYYDEARNEFVQLVESLIPSLAINNPLMANLEIKDSIFRIYRDVRFSKDKSPYKTQMGAYLAPGGRKSIYAGHYIHVEPDNSFLAGGSYCPPGDKLKKIRSEILYNTDEFKSIINTSDFKNLFGDISGSKLKRPPVGFPKDFEDIELLKFKDYTIFNPITNQEIDNPGFLKNAISIFEKMNPFNDFLNRAIFS
ncbi:MAG: DUF2461 domain-containing protein [Bacteroidetes bacterium]|nr:DUF2461 domain-containing protein [Bacteroidota bacterium]